MPSPAESAWTLYNASRIQEAFDAATSALASNEDQTATDELRAILAWCHYRREKYQEALELVSGNPHPRAKACYAYLLAFAPGYTDDAKLIAFVNGERTVDYVNALVIRARAKDAAIDKDMIWALVQHISDTVSIVNYDASTANLFNNAARFFQEKGVGLKDDARALGLFQIALSHYGETSNWHHRAGLFFWLSKLQEKKGDIRGAFNSAVLSLSHWHHQCTLEKNTAPYKEKLDNAVKRLQEVSIKLAEFSLAAKG